MNGLAKWLPFILSLLVVVVGVTASYYTLKADVDTTRAVQAKINEDGEKADKRHDSLFSILAGKVDKIDSTLQYKLIVDQYIYNQLKRNDSIQQKLLEEINDKLE